MYLGISRSAETNFLLFSHSERQIFFFQLLILFCAFSYNAVGVQRTHRVMIYTYSEKKQSVYTGAVLKTKSFWN